MTGAAISLDNDLRSENDGLPPPCLNTELYGHEKIESLLLKDIQNGRLPHGIILSGAAGVGKATLAFRLARYLLSGKAEQEKGGLFGDALPEDENLFVDAEHLAARRIASGGHADLKLIEPCFENAQGKKQATEIIRVYQARQIPKFLSQTAAEGGWRVVIVDGVELMNNQGQNAILKILEEPPEQSIIILVTSEAGKLLPTVHSRCRMFPMVSLDEDIMRKLCAKAGLSKTESAELIKISQGRIGYALSLYEAGGVEIYQQVLTAVRGMTELEKRSLADKLGTKGKEKDFRLFMDLLLDFLALAAKDAAIGGNVDFEPDIVVQHSKHKWFEIWETVRDWYGKSIESHLDKKLVASYILTALEG